MAIDVDKYKKDQVFDETEPSSVTLKKATAFVNSKSFPLPKHWTAQELDQLEFPADLTLLTMAQLGEQMGLWTSVIAYTQYQVAMADVENTAKYNTLEYERTKVYIGLLDSMRGNEAQRQAHLKSNPIIVRLLSESEIARAKYTLLKALLSSYSKYYNAFSRELSRRGVIGGERPPSEDFNREHDVDLSEGRKKGTSLFSILKGADGDDGDS